MQSCFVLPASVAAPFAKIFVLIAAVAQNHSGSFAKTGTAPPELKGFSFMSKRIPPAIAYTISVAYEKGLSIITIPLMATFLQPGAYGRFDVAMSLVEFVILTAGLGLSHTLIRFVSTAKNEAEETHCAAELLGTGLLLVGAIAILVQLLTPGLMHLLKINVETGPLRLLLIAGATSVLIEMPLVWLRLKGDAQRFMLYTIGRATAQALTTWTVLAMGFGVPGVMVGNSTILLIYAALLTYRQWHLTGVLVTARSLQRIRDYGLPLVGASLAMFAIGNANRLFLPGHVSDAEIAHFGIASRLAMAAALLFYPFELWWEPQRIRYLHKPGGLAQSATIWGLGMSIILLSALMVSLAGPLFIAVVLPKTYLEAAYLLPLLVATQVLHQAAILSNVGCYARDNGMQVLSIDMFGALVAIIGFLTLTPLYGLYGIIFSMVIVEFLRIALYLFLGHSTAPIPYPFVKILLAALLTGGLIYLAPAPSQTIPTIGWGLLSLGVVGLFLYKMGMLELPPHIQEQLMSMVRRVRNA